MVPGHFQRTTSVDLSVFNRKTKDGVWRHVMCPIDRVLKGQCDSKKSCWGEGFTLALKQGTNHLVVRDQDVMGFTFFMSPLWREGQMNNNRGSVWWWGCYHWSISKQMTCSWARKKHKVRRPHILGAFNCTNSSAENPSQEWQRSGCWLMLSLGDSSRQFYHPAVLFFKTKVIGIELQSFAKTLAINSAISQIAL